MTVTTTKEVPRKLVLAMVPDMGGRLALLAIVLAAGVVVVRLRFHK